MDKERHLKSVRIANDLNSVDVKFDEVFDVAPPPGVEVESTEKRIPYSATVPFRPHKNLTESMKKLRKYGLQHLGIELADEAKAIKNWQVPAIKISGDHNKQKSRVNITLAVVRDSENIKEPKEIETGQITLYPTSENKAKNPNHEKIAEIVDDIIQAVWDYLDGLHEEGTKNPQLALFCSPTLQE